MAHIWNEEAKKDMKLLNLLSQNRILVDSSINNGVSSLICAPDLHDIDALL